MMPTIPAPVTCDLVVLGGGVAGLTAALVAADAGAEVTLLAKGPVRTTASYLAQGGIAAAVGEGDAPELHADDTLRAGRGLCRPSAVEVLTEEAPARVEDLRYLGVEFDDGPGLEGGHSRPRIRVAEGEQAVDLWAAEGRCVGALTTRRALAARAVVLATGGYAALWERTT